MNLRAVAVLLALSAAMPSTAAGAADAADGDALTPQLAAQLRACLREARRQGGDDALGLRKVRVAADCPALAARLGSRPLPGMRGRWFDEDGSMTLRQLGDLQRLVEAAAEPRPFVGQLSSPRLAAIIEALDPAARGELSTRARLARWWRAVVGEFDPTKRETGQRRRRIEWPLGFWSSVSWAAFATAVLLVATVLVQEIRAALALRPGRRRRRVRRAPPAAARPDIDSIDRLPPRERAGALLRAVSMRLHESGALRTPDPLTPREVEADARLAAGEREDLAAVTRAAELGAFGREAPTDPMLARARRAALRWIPAGAPRRWSWPRADGARAR